MDAKEVDLIEILPLIGACKSRSQARRLIDAGAVEIDNQKLLRFVSLQKGQWLRCGKHFFWQVDDITWEDKDAYYIWVM